MRKNGLSYAKSITQLSCACKNRNFNIKIIYAYTHLSKHSSKKPNNNNKRILFVIIISISYPSLYIRGNIS